MSYVSHSQIWALQKDGRFYLGGRTNRAQVTFEREVIEILDQLSSQTPSVDPIDTSNPPVLTTFG
jgi:cytochrome c biogenesis protein